MVVRVSRFDFTIFSLHLTFDNKNAASSVGELKNLLDWLNDNYFSDEDSDPDVIITGDFNLPTIAGKAISARKTEERWIPIETVIQQHGALSQGKNQLFVFMDERSSRNARGPVNNYDHFIISKDFLDEEFIRVEIVDTQLIDNIDATSGKLISDHYPIRGIFRSKGTGIALDSE